jgi:hypothetical protein
VAGPEKELLPVLVDNKTRFAAFEAGADSVRAAARHGLLQGGLVRQGDLHAALLATR